MVKKKGEKKQRATNKKSKRSLAKMTHFKTDPIQSASFILKDDAETTHLARTGKQKEFGEQINDILGAQGKRLLEINQKMAAIPSELAPLMEPIDPSNDIIIRISKTWEKYQPDMNEHLKDLLYASNGKFKNISTRYFVLSSRMHNALSKLGTAQDMPKAQLELLEIWLGLSHEMSSHISSSMSTGGAEIGRLKDTWSALMKEMNKLAIELQGQSPWMTKTVERLQNSSREMNKDLMAYVEDSLGHMVRLQNLWVTNMSDMSQGFMNTVVRSDPFFVGEKTGRKDHTSEDRTI